MGYRHLNIDEREVILEMRAKRRNLQEIAEKLGRNKGTISRELTVNKSSTGEYKPHLAQRYYRRRRGDSKEPYRLQDKRLAKYVCKKLKQYWSPEQISGRLKVDYAKNQQMRISPVTIYSWIEADKKQGGKLYKYLRQGKRKRRKRYGSTERRGQIPDRRMIDERPKAVEKRSRIGDWESDSVVGKSSGSYIATHVERKSRYLVAARLKDKSAESMNQTTIKAFGKIESSTLKTMTFDNGKEFAGFKELEDALEIKTYFAKPYHSWERGTNENTNGLIRQFFPKGTDFAEITKSELDKKVELLNNRPRKCLRYRTPAEVFWSR